MFFKKLVINMNLEIHDDIFMIISLKKIFIAQVNETVPYFHPAEVGILNQLLDIATDYWTIENFIKEHVNTVFVTGKLSLMVYLSTISIY